MVGLHTLPIYSFTSNPSHILGNYANDILNYAGLNTRIVPVSAYEMGQAAARIKSDNNQYNMLDALIGLYRQAGKVPTLSAHYYDGKMSVLLDARSPITHDALDYANNTIPIEVEKQFQPVTEVKITYPVAEGNVIPVKTKVMTRSGTWVDSTTLENMYTAFEARTVTVVVSEEEFNLPDWDAIIESVQLKDTAAVSVANDLKPDVGDIVTAKDEVTGISATAKVSSVSLHISNDVPIFNFDTEQNDT